MHSEQNTLFRTRLKGTVTSGICRYTGDGHWRSVSDPLGLRLHIHQGGHMLVEPKRIRGFHSKVSGGDLPKWSRLRSIMTEC